MAKEQNRDKRLRVTEDEVVDVPLNAAYVRRMFAYAKPYKKEIILSIVVMIICSAAGLASPLIMQHALDDCIVPGDFTELPWLSLAMVATSTLAAFCVRWKIKLMDITGRKMLATMREDLFNHIQELSFDFFDSRSAGKIMVRVINDVNSLLDLFTNGIVNSLSNIVTLFLIAGLMLFINTRLALIAFCVLPFLIAFIFYLRPLIKRTWRKVRAKISSMNGYLHECLSGIRVTEAYVREERNSTIFRNTCRDIATSWMKAIYVNNAFWPGLEFVSCAGNILIYWFGVKWMYVLGDTTITVGVMTAMINYLGRFWWPLNQLSNMFTQLMSAMSSLERIYEIMDYPVSVKSEEGAELLGKIEGTVDFEHVVFGYDKNQVVLNDVNFHVAPGQTIALVGPTGAGKSTVVNLVTRFYDVRSGAVKIDGRDIRKVDLVSLRKQMGIMMQDTFIFSGTIIDNIRYGRLDATDDECIEAAKEVNAYDFIMRMEKGFYTEVNERGSRLSVGQKQLIAFARVLLADPSILILDEATAAIDTHTEILIQKALERVLRGRTSFVIAHRLSTIRSADNIMVVDQGNVIEHGTHDELMEKKGHYYKLTVAQYDFLRTLG